MTFNDTLKVICDEAQLRLKQAKNFPPALARRGVAWARGQEIDRTPEEAEANRQICIACAFYEERRDYCLQCGCKVNKKSRWATSTCPLGYWQPATQKEITTTVTTDKIEV